MASIYFILSWAEMASTLDIIRYMQKEIVHTHTHTHTPGRFWKAPLRDKTGKVSPLKTASKPQINDVYSTKT